MFKHKKDEYRVPRREKFFRLLTLMGLLVALAVLLENATVPVPAPASEAYGCDDYVLPAIAKGGKIVIDCGGVLHLPQTQVIRVDTEIIGAGEVVTSISGDGMVGDLFQVDPGATLTLSGLRLTNSVYAAVYVEQGGRLEVYNSRFAGHATTVIRNLGNTHLRGVTFEQNIAAHYIIFNLGGSVNIGDSVFRDNGSTELSSELAILTNQGGGTMSVNNSIIENNQADYTALIYNTRSVMTIQNSYIRLNRYRSQSAALILNDHGGSLTITGSQIMSNHVPRGTLLWDGGTLILERSMLMGNSARNCLHQPQAPVVENVCQS